MPKYKVRLRSTEWHEFEVEGTDLSQAVASTVAQFGYIDNPKLVNVSQEVEMIEELKPEDLKDLKKTKAEEFFKDYVKDNAALEGMPSEGRDYIVQHQEELYDAYLAVMHPAFGYADEWEATEVAVREVLKRHCIDDKGW